MHNHTIKFTIFLTALTALLIVNSIFPNQTATYSKENPLLAVTPQTPGVINVDGDVSMSEQLNRIYWNPHCVGLSNASDWKVTFNNETEILLKTAADEAGHVATGAWWTTNFISKQKIQLYNQKQLCVQASFRANVVVAKGASDHEWIRIALACAVQRNDGSVVYTEMDFYDSPSVLSCPSGNISSGGNVIYKGGDVVEYKIAQIVLGTWANYSLELTDYIDHGWLLKPGDMLESVYIVVEIIGETHTLIGIDDLWIACSS
jgi:hypothetical protein